MQLINDDCLKVLKTMPSNCVDLVVMDAPYEITGTTGGGLN